MNNCIGYHFAYAPFESARKVTILPSDNPSSRMHGHSFIAKVCARAEGLDALPLGDGLECLVDAVTRAVAPLNYAYLNDLIEMPTDENVARYIRNNLDTEACELIGVQSIRTQGVDLDADENAHIWRKFRFEAAHRLPNVEPGHPCGRMHGHGFEVVVHANQSLRDRALGITYEEIGNQWDAISGELSYRCLNEVAGLENPTSEVIATWIWNRLHPTLAGLDCVSVYETKTAGCHYDGKDYRIWKDQTFEGAVRRLGGTADDRKLSTHGHSYLIRLNLCAALDEVMGWTVDYGDVKKVFRPVYDQLDHHDLTSITGMKDNDSFSILEWIRSQAGDRLPELDRIDLFETPDSGSSLSWGVSDPVWTF